MYPNVSTLEVADPVEGGTQVRIGGLKEDWYSVFLQYNPDFGQNPPGIPVKDLRDRVARVASNAGLTPKQQEDLLRNIDRNHDKMIDFEEFCILMARAERLKARSVMLRSAQAVLPKSQRNDNFRYLDQYNCCPPPFFIILITLIEIAVFIYYVVEMGEGVSISKPTPIHSPLIYDPYRRYQAWRYFTYVLIHIGIYHILFNSLTQLFLGLPLELVHKWWRVGLVYILGALGGSLAVSVCDPRTFLAGASGGAYALIAAHVANLVVNWDEMEFAWVRLIFVTILVGSDFGVAIYNRYYNEAMQSSRISVVAHIGGFIAGLLMGIVVLRNFRKKDWERIVWWIALVGFILLVAFAVCWNIFYASQYYDSVTEPFLYQKPQPYFKVDPSRGNLGSA